MNLIHYSLPTNREKKREWNAFNKKRVDFMERYVVFFNKIII